RRGRNRHQPRRGRYALREPFVCGLALGPSPQAGGEEATIPVGGRGAAVVASPLVELSRDSWSQRARTIALRLLTTTVSFVAVLCATLPAGAQTRTFYLDRAQLSGAPDDGFMVWRPYMHEETRFYGNFAAGFTVHPLRVNNMTDVPDARRNIDDPIAGQILLYPSVGTEIARRLGLNLMLPIVPYQFTGDDPVAEGIGNGGLTGTHTALD